MGKKNNAFENLVAHFNGKIHHAIKKIDSIYNYQKYLFIYLFVIAIFLFLFYKFGFFVLFTYSGLNLKYLLLLFALTVLQILTLVLRYNLYSQNHFRPKQIVYYLAGLATTLGIPPKPLGEAMRLLVLKYYYNAKYHNVLLCIILENLFDFSITLFIGLIAAIFLPFPTIMDRLLLTVLFIILGIIFVAVFYYFLQQANIKIKTGDVVFSFLRQILTNAWEQIKKLKLLSFRVLFFSVFLTLLKMFFISIRIYFIFLVFGVEINYFVVLGLWALCELIAGASLLPGGLGAYELAFVFLSGVLGITGSVAFGVILLERIFSLWIPLIIGTTIIFFSKKPIKEMKEEFFKYAQIQVSNLFKVYLKTTAIADKIKDDAKKLRKNISPRKKVAKINKK